MEQIYTIPVNEAFEASRESGGCPFCALAAKLEADETELILGASMMEPDVRQKTNEQGFCALHYKKLLAAGKRLPLTLILESHLSFVSEAFAAPGMLASMTGATAAKKLNTVSCSCYICDRVEYNLVRMLECAALLWESDNEFRAKFAAQSGFCLPHAARLLTAAHERFKGKSFAEFYKSLYAVEKDCFDAVEDKVTRFAKSFDYRYANEPIDDVRDAAEQAIRLLSGESRD